MRGSYINRPPALNYSQGPFHSLSHSQQLAPNACCVQQPQSYIETIPYEKKTVDYYPQEKVEYIPQEQKYQDFIDVQHEVDYVPVPRLEKYTDHVPLEKFDTYYDYMPRQNTIVRSVGSNYVPPANQQCCGQISSGQRYGSFYPTSSYSGSFYPGPSYQQPSYYGPQYRPMGNYGPAATQMGNYGPRYQSPNMNAGRAPFYQGSYSGYSGYSRYRYP